MYMKDYSSVDQDWTYLGLSPLNHIRLPRQFLRLEAKKTVSPTSLAP